MKKEFQHRNHSNLPVYIKEFLEEFKRKKYSPKSIDAYGNGLKNFAGYIENQGVKRIQDVSFKTLSDYQLKLIKNKYAAQTTHLYMRSVRLFFKHLEEKNYVFINPASDMKLARPERKLKSVPTEEEIKSILLQPNVNTVTGLRDRAILETAYCCGLRLSELTNIQFNHLDLKDHTIRIIGKGSKERALPLGKQAISWIKRYMEDGRSKLIKDLNSHHLWVGRTGKKLSYVTIDQLIRDYGQKAGVKLSSHDLRRACVTHMLRNGAHPIDLQMFLGHSSLKTLGQYLRLTITDLKKTHEKSRLGR